jgi:hypothetical protein
LDKHKSSSFFCETIPKNNPKKMEEQRKEFRCAKRHKAFDDARKKQNGFINKTNKETIKDIDEETNKDINENNTNPCSSDKQNALDVLKFKSNAMFRKKIQEPWLIEYKSKYYEYIELLNLMIKHHDQNEKMLRTSSSKSKLEIEACIMTSCGKKNEMSKKAFDETLITLRSGFDATCWSKETKWHRVEDYFMFDGSRYRIVDIYDDGKKKRCVEHLLKQFCSRIDFKMFGRNCRINVKKETKMENSDSIEQFLHLRISMRKNFVVQSKCVPGVSFQYTLIKSWEALSESDVERKIIHNEPTYRFEIEILECPSSMDLKTKTMIFLSLLLKLKDLFVLPCIFNDTLPLSNEIKICSSLP